jgi:hypothetical protein
MSGACDNTLIHNVHAVLKKKHVCWSMGENYGAKIVQNVFFGREIEKITEYGHLKDKNIEMWDK